MFRELTKDDDAFVIAEVGQNHQGDLDTAREYIRVFAWQGADAIKFQTRNNRYLFSKEAYERPYLTENAFCATYGEHREKLELKPEWLPILKKDCEQHGVRFMSTPFDEPSLELLMAIGLDVIKIASFDLGNLPFLNRIAQTGKPVVLSVGGGQREQVRASVQILLAGGVDVAVLHCVSEYPCEFNRLGLDNIERLIEEFPDCVVGLSDHFNGILSGPVGYLKGARVFEKHVTLNRAWKGTDHSFSLEPDGFRRFARDVKRVRYMLQPKPPEEVGTEPVFKRLGKSVMAYVDIKAGDVLSLENLSGRIFPEIHIPVRDARKVIGVRARRAIPKGEPIFWSDLESETQRLLAVEGYAL